MQNMSNIYPSMDSNIPLAEQWNGTTQYPGSSFYYIATGKPKWSLKNGSNRPILIAPQKHIFPISCKP